MSWKPRSQPCAAAVDEHARRPQRRDAEPVTPPPASASVCPPASSSSAGLGGELEHHHDDAAQREREPGRLHADVQRLVVLARAEEAGRARRRAVLQEGREAEDLGSAAGRASARPASGTVPRWPMMAVSPST